MGRGWVCCLLALCLLACGGRSERHEDDGAQPSDGTGDDDQGEPSAPSSPSMPNDGVALPGCELGDRDTGELGEDCMWLADGRCYREKLGACGCICPRDHESVCSSGFPSEAGRTPVYCS